MEITTALGAVFASGSRGPQAGGVGIETVRSVSSPGETGMPVTPSLSRYFDSGTIGVVGAAETLLVVELVVQIDW